MQPRAFTQFGQLQLLRLSHVKVSLIADAFSEVAALNSPMIVSEKHHHRCIGAAVIRLLSGRVAGTEQ